MTHTAPRFALIVLLGAIGCNTPVPVFESLVPAEEPVITGRIVTPAGAPSGPVRAAVLWNHYGEVGAADEIAAESEPVGAGFPAPFSMAIEAPPAAAILDGSLVDAKPRIGYGLIVALRDDAAEASPFERMVGGCRDHVVVYTEADMQPGTVLDLLMHGRLAEGFHLMRVIREVPTCYGDDDEMACYGFSLHPAPDGFATSVDVEMGTQALISLPSL